MSEAYSDEKSVGAHREIPMSNEVAGLEYEIRLLNNEIFDIHNRATMTLDDVRELDGLMTQKAILMMQAHSSAFPEASTTLKEMMTTLSASDDADEDDEERQRILRQILADLMDAYNEAKPGSTRQEELVRIIQSLEYLLLAITMRRRRDSEDFGLAV